MAASKTTQKQRVLTMLESAGSVGVRTNQFLDAHIPRFGGRLHELRQDGYRIETRKDSRSESGLIYELVGRDTQTELATRPRKPPDVNARLERLTRQQSIKITVFKEECIAPDARFTIERRWPGGAETVIGAGPSLWIALEDAERREGIA